MTATMSTPGSPRRGITFLPSTFSSATSRLALACALAMAWAGCDSGPVGARRDAGPRGDGSVFTGSDSDGDGISDADEGLAEGRDTDGDGTPDGLDDDSDGDGFSDAEEAGDADPATQPRDTDADGIPDYVDLDSDQNGIPDAADGRSDGDGDGLDAAHDRDDDGDGLLDSTELGSMTSPPRDTDGDGIPDHRDLDSDDDTISDTHERDIDTDRDGIVDMWDDDSDNDGISDADEAGDTSISTPPRDTDGDTIPDFRDPDSDDDGLSDHDEVTIYGTSPISADTDMDGVGDLVEIAAGTDATNPADNPRTRGDFVFVVPYMEPPDPTRDTLSFRTSVQFADIYFSFDTTTSMSAELTAMRSPTTGVPAIIDALRCAPTGGTCATDDDCAVGVCFAGACVTDPMAGAGCIPDMWTGVATWNELNTFRNRLAVQPDPMMTAASIPGTSAGAAEAPFHPPYCAASASTAGCAACATTGIGCGGFRSDAVRIYVQITDADQQCSGTACSMYTAAGAGAALRSEGIRFIGLYGTDDAGGIGTPQSVATDIANAATAPGDTSGPYVYLAVDSAVVSRTVDAVRAIVRGVPLRVTIEASDEPGDAGDALQFIDRLETNTSGAMCAVLSTEDTDFDGFPDAYPAVTPGNRVCWDVVPLENTTVMPGAEPQIFRARLTVRGDGSPVDSRIVYFLVPPAPPVIDVPI